MARHPYYGAVQHPDPGIGFFDEEVDLTAPELYAAAKRPFGKSEVLPPLAYRSMVFADLEDEKMWSRVWVCIGSGTQIPKTGDLLPHTVGNHGIHVQREPDGTLRGRFNRHQHGGCRAIPLQCQRGVRTKCPVTSCGVTWDGREDLDHIPEDSPQLYQYVGFRPDKLFPVKVETWGPFVFVNLDVDPRPFAEQLGDLPQLVGTYAVDDLRRVAYKWSYVPCNWKLAGRSFVNSYSLPYDPTARETPSPPSGSPGARDGATYAMFTVDLPEQDAEVGRGSPLPALPTPAGAREGKATFCWVFPDLLLALMPDHVASIVLAPASTRDCLQRLSLFVSAAAEDTPAVHEEIARLTRFWLEASSQQAAVGAAEQKEADDWGTPSRPETSLPVESNFYGYQFQRFLIDRILTKYPYYGDETPLYRNPIRSRDAYYGGRNVHFR